MYPGWLVKKRGPNEKEKESAPAFFVNGFLGLAQCTGPDRMLCILYALRLEPPELGLGEHLDAVGMADAESGAGAGRVAAVLHFERFGCGDCELADD